MSLADALPALDQLVVATAVEHHCPTIAWGIVADGRVAHMGSTGLLHDGRPPTEHTVYRIASMTKSFTAAVVLTLRDEGVLSLEDAIVDHTPELAAVASPAPGAGAIRIRDLLSMSSGLATDDAWADRNMHVTDEGLDEAVAHGVLFAGQPGDVYEYSNLGYGLIGRVVKRATGRRVQELITERMLEPLGMSRSSWTQPRHDDWARPFAERDGHAVDAGAPLDDGELAPMGGIWTSIDDLARWITWLDDGYRTDSSDDVLSRASRRELQQMHRYIGLREFGGRTSAAGYGFGLNVRDDPRIGRVIAHSGGLPGYGSNMRWLSGRRFGVVAFGNVTYAPMTDLGQKMLDVLADHYALPAPAEIDGALVRDLGTRLIELLGDWTDRAAAALFTDNVIQDDPYERRRAEAERWVEACGGELRIERFDVERPTSGRVAVAHPDGGRLWIDFQIAPMRPPKIQLYGFELEPS